MFAGRNVRCRGWTTSVEINRRGRAPRPSYGDNELGSRLHTISLSGTSRRGGCGKFRDIPLLCEETNGEGISRAVDGGQ